MAQNPTVCPTSLDICRIRASRLNADGTYKVAANNHVVSDRALALDVKPEIKAGKNLELEGGCDSCVAVSYKGTDRLMRFNFTLQTTAIEAALIELLTGAPVNLDASVAPVAVGNQWPDQLDCSSPVQAPTALEVWTKAWAKDRQVDPPFQYYRWIWPMTFWQISNFKLESDFLVFQLDGYSRSNPNFGNAYGDWPAGITKVGNIGGFFLDTLQPIAVCGYSSSST
jgi:hypothetical protein